MSAELSVEMEKVSLPKQEQISPSSNSRSGDGLGQIDSCFSLRDSEHSLNLWETHTMDLDGSDDISSRRATTERDWTDMGREHTHYIGLDINKNTSDAVSNEVNAAFDDNKNKTRGRSKSIKRNLSHHDFEASKRNRVGDNSIKTYEFGFNYVNSMRTDTSSGDSDSEDYSINLSRKTEPLQAEQGLLSPNATVVDLSSMDVRECSGFGSNKSKEVFHRDKASVLHPTNPNLPVDMQSSPELPTAVVDLAKDSDSSKSPIYDTELKDIGQSAEASTDIPHQTATAGTKPKADQLRKKPFRVKGAIVKEVHIEECDSGDETIQSDPYVANKISAMLRSAEEPKLVVHFINRPEKEIISATYESIMPVPTFPDILTADKFTCSQCHEQFPFFARNQAVAHMKTHSPQSRRIFTCCICSMMFLNRRHYNNHERFRHPDSLFRKCEQAECKSDVKFYSVMEFKIHMKEQHFADWRIRQ